jgi:putative membrane protein
VTLLVRPPIAARVSLGVMVAAMIATPLFTQGGDQRRALANVVVLSLFAVGLLTTWAVHRMRAIVAAGAVVVTTYFIELLGSTTGFPFGTYDYTSALTPQVAGVPLLVSFAWAGVTLVVYGMFAGGLARWVQLAMMAASITAWDVFLDPQMVGEGYWQWQPASLAFRGIPLVNYVGWFATALINSTLVMAICRAPHAVKSHALIPHGLTSRDATLQLSVITYATLTVLSTIGFVFFFDDVVVAVVGAVAMGTCLWWGLRRSRRSAIGLT